VPQPGDIPGPQPSGDRQEVPAPEASDSPIGSAEPNGGRRTRSWRRRMGFAAVAVAVAVAGAAPVAWQALSEPEGEKPKPGAEACRGPADTASKPNPEARSGPAGTVPAADFDSDGVQDTYATGESGGGVFVVYGRKGGAHGGADKEECRRRLTLDSPGVPGKEGRGVAFGAHTVARDIDKDGYTDLVASVMSYRSDARSGLIALWGSSKGLSGGTYLKGMPKDYLGTGIGDDPLVAGEFTGDDDADLVVRVGSEHGLLKGPFSREGKPSGTAEVPNPFPEAKQDAQFLGGYAGDLNGDGTEDLVTSHATEDDGVGGGEVETGYVPGGREGFGEPDTESLPGIKTATIGDVDKDSYADIVLRKFPKGSAPDSGVDGPVEVFHGSKNGPDPERHTKIDQDSPGVPGKKVGSFGDDMDAGDADGDGYADVAVGAPVSLVDKGKSSVTVLRGGPKGLNGRGARLVEEPSSSPEPSREDGRTIGNVFGGAVRLGDANGDGKTDLAVGAPITKRYDGALWIFPGRKGGWPEEAARSYGPGDFGGPDASDQDQIGADVR
jgi:FG-GAP repeat